MAKIDSSRINRNSLSLTICIDLLVQLSKRQSKELMNDFLDFQNVKAKNIYLILCKNMEYIFDIFKNISYNLQLLEKPLSTYESQK